MNKNFINTILISDNEINHLLFLKKKGDVIIDGISRFNFPEFDEETLENALAEISSYVKKNKLTHLNLITDSMLKNIIVIDEGTVNIRNEILNRFKDTFDINLSEYYIDYEIYKFQNRSIVFVAGILRDYLEKMLKVFKRHKFKLLSLETDIIALKRGMGLFLSDDIVMNIHMRKDKTVFLIVQGDILFAFRELNFGYENIINYLTESTGEEEDVIVKKLAENKEVFEELPVSESLDKLTIELQRTIDFYNNQFRNDAITKLVLTGSLLKIKGIEKFLSQLFIIKSEKINLLKYLFINVDSELLENLNFLTETIGTGLREI